MAVSTGSFGRNGSRRSRRAVPVSDINVTPLVDVMLVLLIVFMVTAPLLTVGVPVDLPKSQGKAMSEPKEPLTITVDKGGDIYLMNSKVTLEDLVEKLKGVTDANPETRIYVRGDQGLSYGRIMEVMGLINSAGFTRVALVADMPKNKGSGA